MNIQIEMQKSNGDYGQVVVEYDYRPGRPVGYGVLGDPPEPPEAPQLEFEAEWIDGSALTTEEWYRVEEKLWDLF